MASPLLKTHAHVAAAAALHSARRAGLHGCCPATCGFSGLQIGRLPGHGVSANQSKRSAQRGSAKVNALPSLDAVPLMVTMVEHVVLSRDYVVHKSIWHLSDAALKSVCEFAFPPSLPDQDHSSLLQSFPLILQTVFLSSLSLAHRYLLRHVHGLGRLLLCVHEGKHAAAAALTFTSSPHKASYILQTNQTVAAVDWKQDPFYDSDAYRSQGGDGTVHWYYDKQEDLEASAREDLMREDLLEEIELRVGGLRELEEAGKEEQLAK
ncbi:hypothetical protein U9M48_021987 [Paspalum notatum var. saurae]|uniref:Uncharacterized protein n=1 Tax=Paspalum notatum var. saurae TaxID=547442 RepID=A0AAQ3WT99_PASNO